MTDFFDFVGTNVRKTPGESPTPVIRGKMTGSSRAWAENDGVFWGTPQSHKILPSGVYRLDLYDNLGPVFIKQKNDTDFLIDLPDSESAKIVSEIQQFKELRPQFQKHGFLYKRGILMWGPPGSGKTCTLQLIMRLLMEKHDSVAVLVDRPDVAGQCLQALRRIEPDRQVVAILEDIDALCESHGESEYLALLDGESQVDNIIYCATTNYPERLDRRFVDRPSRFDTIRYIGMPTPDARRAYLMAKAPEIDGGILEEYVAESNDYSIAHLRELIILTQCFSVPLGDALNRLNATRKQAPESTKPPWKRGLGFVG